MSSFGKSNPASFPPDIKSNFDLPSALAGVAFLFCFALMIYTDYKFVGTPDSAREKGRLLGVIPMQLAVVLPSLVSVVLYRRLLLSVLLRRESLWGVGLVAFGLVVGVFFNQPLAGIAYDIRVFGWFIAGVILGTGVHRFRFEGWVYVACLGAATMLSWLILKNSVMLIADADEVRQTDHLFAQYTELIFPLLVFGLVRFANRNILVWVALLGLYGAMIWLVGAIAITRTYVLQAAAGLFFVGISYVAGFRAASTLQLRRALMARLALASGLSIFALTVGYSRLAEKVASFLLRSATSESANSVLLRWTEFRNNFEMLDGAQLVIGKGLGCQFLNLLGYTWPFLHLGVFVPLFKFGVILFIIWLVFGPIRATVSYVRLLLVPKGQNGMDIRLATLPAFLTWFAGSCMSGGVSEYAFIGLGIVYAHHVLASQTAQKQPRAFNLTGSKFKPKNLFRNV